MNNEDASDAEGRDKTKPTEEKNEIPKAPEILAASTDESFVEPTEYKEAPAPHEEQLKYWKQDLSLKKLSFGLSVVGFIAIIVSIGFNANQIRIATEQLKLNTKQVHLNTEQSERLAESLCYNLQSETLTQVLDLDKVFLERTYLRPYFYDDKPISEKDKYYQEASATAELVLDIFDSVADQNKKHTKCWDDAATWDEWVIDTFSNSPILRETMAERRDWYAKNLLNLYEQALERIKK